MTMSSARRTIPAAAFKARCLALLDEVGETHETVIVTKRGRPVARLVAADVPERRPLRGSVRYSGDLVAPTGGKWDAER
jgi:prevent-host-death family protein